MAKNSTTSAGSHGQERSETSSRCVTEKVTATDNFEVTDFSLLDGMGIGKFISSCTFSVGDCDWNINLFPDGWKEEDNADYVSVVLYFRRGAAGVRVNFTLCLLDKYGGVSNLRSVTETTHTFKAVGEDWGYSKFIKKSKLQHFLRLSDNRLTIRSVVTVIRESRSKLVLNKIVAPKSKLHQDLVNMLKHGEGKDVTFSVRGQLFPAHRSMLAARSMVFKAELFGEMKEKDTRCIEISDMEPSIFEALLHFIYTDSLPDDCDGDKNVMMQHLLVAADRYGVDRLRVICEAELCESIDVQTVATVLALAEQHHCAQLKDACLGFIASRDVLGVVMGTEEFKHLATSCPSIMKDISDKVAANAIRSE